MSTSRRQFLKRAAAGLMCRKVATAGTSLAQQPIGSGAARESLVESVRYLGNQFLENQVGVTGADGATSTVLPSGVSLWLFGDTVEGPFKSIRGLDLTRLRSNTGAIVRKQNASHGIKNYRFLSDEGAKRPRQVVPFASDENPAVNRIWAMHGVVVGPNIYVFYHRITLLKGVEVFINFQLDGMGI